MCLSYWFRVCEHLNKAFERFYYKLGYVIASRPKLFIGVSIVTCLLFCTGFARFHELNRVEKLYIPQNSQAMIDLNRGSRNFPLKARQEEFILKYHDNNRQAIDKNLLTRSLDVDLSIVMIPGYKNVCMTNKTAYCITLSPLEMFDFNKSEVSKGVERVDELYATNALLDNGRSTRMLYHQFFGDFKEDDITGHLTAESIRVQYLLRYPENDTAYKAAEDWEQLYLNVMGKWQQELHAEGMTLLYAAGRSANDDVLKSAEGDVKLAVVSLLLMFIFCSLTLGKFRDLVTGHLLLGLGGILTLVLGIGGAFGFILLIGYPFIAFSGVLPFLIIGVGIDNMFIIVDSVDREDPGLQGAERIAKALSHVGASVTMTTLTDLIAFSVSTVTDFPAIKYFSLYVAASISLCFVLVLTLFLALLALDMKRIDKERMDILPCIVWPRNPEKAKEVEDDISTKIMRIYGKTLMQAPVKWSMLLASIALLSVSVMTALRTDQSFDANTVGLENSNFAQLSRYRDQVFPNSFEISVIIDEPLDYADGYIQRQYSELGSIAEQNSYVKNASINWMHYFLFWAESQGKKPTGEGFYPNLKAFLQQQKQFESDVKFHPNGTISASRMVMFGGDSLDSLYRRDEMVSLREDLMEKTDLPAYATSQHFIFTAQFVIILRDTIRNLAISSGAILVITIPYLIHPIIGFLVFISFVSLIFELLAIMFIWGVTLNSLSMIIIVMAIGFAVDYSAHIAHAFMVSKEKTAEGRVVDALETIGTSVLMGGTSTFIGILVTGFATSGIFRIFFKMVFGIVVLGLIHGLVFLPVLLAIFCPGIKRPPSIDAEEEDGQKKVTLTRFQITDQPMEPTNNQLPGSNQVNKPLPGIPGEESGRTAG